MMWLEPIAEVEAKHGFRPVIKACLLIARARLLAAEASSERGEVRRLASEALQLREKSYRFEDELVEARAVLGDPDLQRADSLPSRKSDPPSPVQRAASEAGRAAAARGPLPATTEAP